MTPDGQSAIGGGQRHVCVHGHFYQPPRENPWLEAIESQDSAYPYHDWNERITAECYLPNAATRILDDRGRIRSVVNNYEHISFNVGPTLMSWLEGHAPAVYAAVLDADRASLQRLGHGNAIAQPYNHMIMPLANRRDKVTQVRWGLNDFRHRFGREPEGMWLPETAVDIETLEVLAEHGVRFSVLAPHQAQAIRPIGAHNWTPAAGESQEMKQPLRCHLPTGRSIDLFFYHGPTSRAVAFEGVLRNGEAFGQRLLGILGPGVPAPALAHIAADGETYGHHHRHGEMALAYALDRVQHGACVTNYAAYLAMRAPTHEVQIRADSSWSCAHGIERWRGDCGCHTGGEPGWNQAWRAPLRAALDWLRDELAPRYEREAQRLLRNPWSARDDYIHVVLDRAPASIQAFLEAHAQRDLAPDEVVRVLKLLEIQRQAMLMYTSCGWFFTDLAGIETVQVLQYAGRALELAREVFGEELEPSFRQLLCQARSNVAEQGDGGQIWDRSVTPGKVDLRHVAGHYALAGLFEDFPRHAALHCFDIERLDSHTLRAGRHRAIVGTARVTNRITRESQRFVHCAVHFGGHSIHGGARASTDEASYKALVDGFSESFNRADIPDTVRLVDKHFPGATFSLQDLLRDPKRKIIHAILETHLADIEAVYAQLYEQHAPLLRFLGDVNAPLPRAFQTTAEFVLNQRVRRALARVPPDPAALAHLEEAKHEHVRLDTAGLAYAFETTLARVMDAYEEDPSDGQAHANLRGALDMAAKLPFEVNLWDVQRRYYELMRRNYGIVRAQAEKGDQEAGAWVARFAELGERLHVRVP